MGEATFLSTPCRGDEQTRCEGSSRVVGEGQAREREVKDKRELKRKREPKHKREAKVKPRPPLVAPVGPASSSSQADLTPQPIKLEDLTPQELSQALLIARALRQ